MLKKFLRLIFLCFFLANTCGCALLIVGAAGGAGTATWMSGKLSHHVNSSIDVATKATLEALKNMKLNVAKETRKDNVVQIMSNYTDGKTIWIDIHKTSQSSSIISIRVGMLGNEEGSEKILNNILKKL